MTATSMTGSSVTLPSVQNKYYNKSVMVPPMRYDLRGYPTQTAIDYMDMLVENYPLAKSYLDEIRPRLSRRHGQTVFGYIPAPPDVDVLRQVIGANGHFLKLTTTLCNVDFIWFSSKSNTFMFWGPTTFSVVKALNSIRWRIQKCYLDRAEAAAATDNEDYSQMPALISEEELQRQLQQEQEEEDEFAEEHSEWFGVRDNYIRNYDVSGNDGLMRISSGCEPEYESGRLE